MKQSGLLMADAAINLILGILLVFFPPDERSPPYFTATPLDTACPSR